MIEEQTSIETAVTELQSSYRGYIRELDGLRAFAILGVLFFHLHCPGFSLAWAGVPLFFVISGFLITRILLNTRAAPFYFRNFYVRRSLRIFPIYYLTLFCYFAILAIIGPHSRIYGIFAGTGGGNPFRLLPYYLTYLQIIPQIHSGFTVLPLLEHTWSLAVEEQFYWFWPVVVFAVRKERLWIAVCLLFLVGPMARMLALMFSTDRHFVTQLPFDHLDTLMIGAFIAWVTTSGWARLRLQQFGWICTVIGAVTVLVLYVSTSPSAWWRAELWLWKPANVFLFTGMALLFGGIVALCVADTRAMRWLGSPALVHIGRISYGIYLYHILVFFVVSSIIGKFHHGITESLSGWRILVIACSITTCYFVALASWKFIEAPINALKDRFTLRSVPEPGAANLGS